MSVNWPTGMRVFYMALDSLREDILGGTLVVVDPSIGSRDSQPGYAIFHKGKLQATGTAAIDFRATAYDRLRLIHGWMRQLLPGPPDVFAVEAIPKALGHQYTLWAVGATITGADSGQTIEVPIPFWKAYSKTRPDYSKGDAWDARIMGEAMIAYLREAGNVGAA